MNAKFTWNLFKKKNQEEDCSARFTRVINLLSKARRIITFSPLAFSSKQTHDGKSSSGKSSPKTLPQVAFKLRYKRAFILTKALLYYDKASDKP